MSLRLRVIFLSVILSTGLGPRRAAALTSPDDYLGYHLGADRKLAGLEEIDGYLTKLDQESERIFYCQVGTSTQGRPLNMAVISTEQNMARLNAHRTAVRRLADPRTLSGAAVDSLVAEGKVFVLFLCNQHSNEIASSNTALELAWSLAAGTDPVIERALQDVVVMIVPTANPDGQQMIVDYYDRFVGTPYEGGDLPWLYHQYSGHDNNRDWFFLNLAETRALVEVMYGSWHPQVLLDVHQMGSSSVRMFVPPFYDPPNPNNPRLVWEQIEVLGSYMKYCLAASGKSGVINNAMFSGWYQGSVRPNATQHNITALLTETASARIATPLYVERSELTGAEGLPEYARQMNFIDPWPGGWWRLRDIIDYQLVAMRAMIDCASRHREQFLRNFEHMAAEAVELPEHGAPYAYAIPPRQDDPGAVARLLEIFGRTHCEIQRATEPFSAGGRVYPENTVVLKTGQPYGRFIKDMLEVKPYPDLREYPGGPPKQPYDNAAWSLGPLMGVRVDELTEPFEAELAQLKGAPQAEAASAGGLALLDSRDCNTYLALNMLLDQRVRVERYAEEVSAADRRWSAGALLVEGPERVLGRVADSCRVVFTPVGALPAGYKFPLKRGRVGLYRGWVASEDEGWTRYTLDRFGFDWDRLTNERTKKGGLRRDYEVIILPSLGKDEMITGAGPEAAGWGLRSRPPEYCGGIGKDGVKNLEEFVREGGVLIALREACALPLQEFGLPVREAKGKTFEGEFFCPGSLLRLEVDTRDPVGFGMPQSAAAFWADGVLLETFIPPTVELDRRVVASYAAADPLISGWVVGAKAVQGQPAVVDVSLGKGHVILFGFGPQSRAQSWGTFKLLFNAILRGYAV
ncbi:M14 family metallopeptidase [bacterium]|nr:M14 family metallopeptidase [bacterium]